MDTDKWAIQGISNVHYRSSGEGYGRLLNDNEASAKGRINAVF
jgi:hypothetical protein